MCVATPRKNAGMSGVFLCLTLSACVSHGVMTLSKIQFVDIDDYFVLINFWMEMS